MTQTTVRELSDGEELVLEERYPDNSGDPRERAIEVRRQVLDHQSRPSEDSQT
jgi:hypothetical protein